MRRTVPKSWRLRAVYGQQPRGRFSVNGGPWRPLSEWRWRYSPAAAGVIAAKFEAVVGPPRQTGSKTWTWEFETPEFTSPSSGGAAYAAMARLANIGTRVASD